MILIIKSSDNQNVIINITQEVINILKSLCAIISKFQKYSKKVKANQQCFTI